MTSLAKLKQFVCAASLCIAALGGASAQDTQIQFLSGHDKDDAVPWEFMCTSGANSGFWTNLPVPSQWDVKGFGTLNYHKDLTNAWDEKGLYAHSFTVPGDWSGRRIFLVFDGAMTDTDAKLNGQSVGPIHQGSFYRFKYEVTSLVNFGATNRLEVTVAKHSKNESINNSVRMADYWVFGGIFRQVYLEAVPAQIIERVAINAQADGHFSADVYLNGATNADEVEAQIQTLDGKTVGSPFAEKITGEKITLNGKAASPYLWTAETPNLYAVEIRLKHGKEIIHQIHQRFGFRTFDVRDGDGLYLNGQRVILKGADRHSFWPDSGRCLSEAVHRLDIKTLKDANMNAVRMSHYPPDERFLDLCDELGIYVLDELAGWHHFYDNTVGPKLVHEMVVRDVNHPSILFWDNGNEGGFNTNLDHIFPELDPQQRRVLHPWAAFSGVNTAHYLGYDEAVVACEGAPLYYHASGKTFADTNDTAKYIYMPTEFQHGLFDGGMGAGMDDYWKLMSASKYLGGGFVWALTDDGIKRPDTGAIDTAGNQAPDGMVGPYREREGSFYTIKEIWSPIQITRAADGVLTVENHFDFTDAKECKFLWQLRRLPGPRETNTGFTVVKEGSFQPPAIPPGKKGTLKIPSGLRTFANAFALRVEAPDGRELWTWVWPLAGESGYEVLTHEPAPQHATATETTNAIEVKSGDLMVTFSKETGLLSGVRRGEQLFSLANGPQFTGGTNSLTKITFAEDGPDLVVSERFSGPLQSVSWRVNGNGWVDCNYTYAATGTNNFLGVTFDYPEQNVRHKRWLGDGPYRVWKNRLRGVSLNVWDNDYNNTITGYKDWIYPEFKGVFSNVRWLQLETTEGPITVINNEESVPYFQVLTPEFPATNLVGKAIAPLPQCGLGFLDVIPPIGSKFKAPSGMGPQSQLDVSTGTRSRSVSFYFGKLPGSG